VSTVVVTNYRGFTIHITSRHIVVLDRDGTPTPHVTTMSAARKRVAELRRKERET